jgi:hypothetical protein
MRWSWLSSPAVASLTLVAAVITIGQWLVAILRVPVTLARTIIACPDPLSIQLAGCADELSGWLMWRLARDPIKRPRLFYVLCVPLTTWLSRPAAGLDSYQRHLQAWREAVAAGLRPDPIDTLREWSVRYGMASPDGLGLIRGGPRR